MKKLMLTIWSVNKLTNGQRKQNVIGQKLIPVRQTWLAVLFSLGSDRLELTSDQYNVKLQTNSQHHQFGALESYEKSIIFLTVR